MRQTEKGEGAVIWPSEEAGLGLQKARWRARACACACAPMSMCACARVCVCTCRVHVCGAHGVLGVASKQAASPVALHQRLQGVHLEPEALVVVDPLAGATVHHERVPLCLVG